MENSNEKNNIFVFMPTPKKKGAKRLGKYEKPVKVDATFEQLIQATVDGKGYKPQQKKSK